jgi:peroxidase
MNLRGDAGAHAIGITHCSSFTNRHYSYSSTDSPLGATYTTNPWQPKCGMGGRDAVVEMDPSSFVMFDLGYYHAVLKYRALLQSDTALITGATARAEIAKMSWPAHRRCSSRCSRVRWPGWGTYKS